MRFTRPVPWREALESRAVRESLPTTLSSAQLRGLQAQLRERAMFSARTTNAKYLDQVAGVVQDILGGETTYAQGRLWLQTALDALDYRPEAEEFGTIKDLSSDARLELLLRTNVESAAGYGAMAQANDPEAIDLYPCWELVRIEDRREPRDWESRWKQAAQAAGDGLAYRALVDGGRMVARKSSGTWEMLGTLWDDSLGNPYPPFAFGSGMWTEDVDREDAVALGVISEDERVEPRDIPDLNAELAAGAELRSDRLREELLRELGDAVRFEEGVLTLR